MIRTKLNIFDLNKTLSIDEYLNRYECDWFISTRISQFIVNSMRVYDFFGLRWRLPLWDCDYAGFWYTVPWESKYGSILYNDFMFDCYFSPLGVGIRKSNQSAQYYIKLLAKKLLPAFIKERYRTNRDNQLKARNVHHFNSFEHVINYMFEHIDKTHYPFITKYNIGNINASTSLYYLEQLYK